MNNTAHSQHGSFLIEALVGILVFSLGVLAMVSLGTTAISAQSDAQYRTEAASLANEMASELSLRANRIPQATAADTIAALNASLLPFEHNVGGGVVTCPFTANPSAQTLVTDWVTKVTAALPGVIARGLQVDTTTLAAFSGIRITVCWQGPTDKAVRSYTLVTYIN